VSGFLISANIKTPWYVFRELIYLYLLFITRIILWDREFSTVLRKKDYGNRKAWHITLYKE
jgi:hypothetical protein